MGGPKQDRTAYRDRWLSTDYLRTKENEVSVGEEAFAPVSPEDEEMVLLMNYQRQYEEELAVLGKRPKRGLKVSSKDPAVSSKRSLRSPPPSRKRSLQRSPRR